MGEVLKSFFNFTGISLRFIMWFTTLVVVPATAWFWAIDKDVRFLKTASASHQIEIEGIKSERVRDVAELTRELKEIQRSLGRIEGALDSK